MFSFITTSAFALIGSNNHVENPIIIKVTHNTPVLICTMPFLLVYFKAYTIITTNRMPAIIDPELKGSPIELTKKISKTLNILRMLGAKSLKINNKIVKRHISKK